MIFLLLKLGENSKEVLTFRVSAVAIVENPTSVSCGASCPVLKGLAASDDVQWIFSASKTSASSDIFSEKH